MRKNKKKTYHIPKQINYISEVNKKNFKTNNHIYLEGGKTAKTKDEVLY